LHGKLIFRNTIFENNFIYLKNVIWIYTVHVYSGTPLAKPPTGRHSIGRVSGTGVARHTCIPKGFMQWRTQKISEGGPSFVTILWRHKSTLGEVPKARPF